MIWLAITAAFAAGYAARHYRPLARIDTWAWQQVDRRTTDVRGGRLRRRPAWYGAQAVFAVEVAVAFVVQPRDTVTHIRETRARHRQQREARP
jgi:hypothetical protein